MARTGQFGRRPRTVASLSSTIVAMLREYNAMQDQNIMNAWERGGYVDGKKVTDDMMLAHWKERRDAVSKEDPLWDFYNNQMLNLEFTIEESKMGLKYAQKKVGEGAMAAFYQKWAKKSPTDSQVYRNLMTKAAQFLDAARGRAAGSAASARATAYQNESNSAYKRYEEKFDAANQLLIYAAQREGILTESGETLTDLIIKDQGVGADPVRFMYLFDQIQNDPRFAWEKEQINKYFPGGLTYETFMGLFADKRKGIETRIGLADKYGDKTTKKSLTKDLGELGSMQVYLGDTDMMAEYTSLHERFAAALGQNLPPWVLQDVINQYAGDLERLMAVTGDRLLAGRLNNEIIALRTGNAPGDTLYDDSTPYRGESGTVGEDAKSTADTTKALISQFNTAKNGGVWTRDSKTGVWNAVPVASFGAGTIDLNKGVLLPHVDDNGNVHMIYAPTVPVVTEAVNPVNQQGSSGVVPYSGAGIKPEGGETNILGRAYTDPVTGKSVFSVVANDGSEKWIGTTPFVNGVQVTASADKITVTAAIPDGKGYIPTDFIDKAAYEVELPRSDKEDNPVIARYFSDPALTVLLNNTDINKIRDSYAALDPYLPDSAKIIGPDGIPTSFDAAAWGEAMALAKTLTPYADNPLLRARAAQRVGAIVWTGDQFSMDVARAQAYKLRAMEKYDSIEAGTNKRMAIEREGRANEATTEGYWDREKGTFIRTDIVLPEQYRDAVIDQVRLAQKSEAILYKNRVAKTTTSQWAPGASTGNARKGKDWERIVGEMQTSYGAENVIDPVSGMLVPKKTVTPTLRLPEIASAYGVELPASLQPQNIPASALQPSVPGQQNPGITKPPPQPTTQPVVKPPPVPKFTPPKPAKPIYKPQAL